jgi:hypothetical protein
MRPTVPASGLEYWYLKKNHILKLDIVFKASMQLLLGEWIIKKKLKIAMFAPFFGIFVVTPQTS